MHSTIDQLGRRLRPRDNGRPMPPPILLTVDDDPEVSRSLARDLRQQYGEEYRIRRAESGPAALDALKELKLRDERVGLLLADQRMPEMTGVEFLAEARQLYPRAGRVLLTAYRRYRRGHRGHQPGRRGLLPAEAVGPTAGEAVPGPRRPARGLEAAGPAEVGRRCVRVVGHRWSAPSHEMKDFLTRNQVPFKWIELEQDAEAARLLAANGGDDEHLPLVITESGQALQAPSTAEIAAVLGLS